jgi:hypothetical protein
VNSLCARSNDRRAEASSRVGCLGGGGGETNGRRARTARTGVCVFLTLREGDAIFFWRAVLETLREIVLFGAFDFAGAALRGRAACFLAVLALGFLLAAVRRAFFAGAFAAFARLTIGLGRADFALNVRLLTDDFTEDCREFDRLTLFAIGLLI